MEIQFDYFYFYAVRLQEDVKKHVHGSASLLRGLVMVLPQEISWLPASAKSANICYFGSKISAYASLRQYFPNTDIQIPNGINEQPAPSRLLQAKTHVEENTHTHPKGAIM